MSFAIPSRVIVESLEARRLLSGSIAGKVYDDVNGNGSFNTGEFAWTGITVYSDANNNGKLDTGEQFTHTNSDGNYVLSGLSAGTYKIRVDNDGSLFQTAPANNFGWSITLAADQNVTGKNFGLRNGAPSGGGSISGIVFNDVNADRIHGAGEAGIEGITVYNDANNNGKLDLTEQRTSTNATGAYQFTGLAATSYKIREVLQAGWGQTTPTNNFGWTIVLSANQNVTGKDFGTRSSATPPPPNNGSISGFTFNDSNNNGKRDNGETASGRTVFLDSNQNGYLDAGETSVVTDSNGSYLFTDLDAGTYYIREVLPAGFKYSAPPPVVPLHAGESFFEINIATQPGTPKGSISGFAFNDNNKNGTFDAGDVKTSGKQVFLDANNDGKLDAGEKTSVTNSSGNFSFDGLTEGTYYIRRVFPAGYTYSTSLITVTISPVGEDISGLSIGSKPIA